MTAPVVDFATLAPEDIPEGVPNHKASSGERGEPRMATRGPVKGRKIFGRTGGASSEFAANEKPREAPPQLKPGVKRQLNDFYQFVGASVRPFDAVLGDTIIEQADKCAESVYNLAQSNDAVRRAIIALTTTSAMGAVMMAHLPIILVALRHSKNDTVRNTAMSTMIAVKLSDAKAANDLFNGSEDDSTNV